VAGNIGHVQAEPGQLVIPADRLTAAVQVWQSSANVFSRDGDEDTVAHRGIDAAVKAEVHDAAVERCPGPCGRSVPEDLAGGVDGRLPEIQPVAARPDRENSCIRTGPGGSGLAVLS
jgi:hypothetical protein